MSLPTAVADTSVLICFQHLNLLEHLSHLFKQVLIPASVRVEFYRKEEKKRREDLDRFTSKEFFAECNDYDLVQIEQYMTYRLDREESEALSQTKIRNVDILLIDESAGRQVALREDCRVRGTARLLADLEKLGFTNTWESINRLRHEIGFKISDAIVEKAMKDAGLN